MPVIQPKPTTIIWEVTDQFDLKQMDEFRKSYIWFIDGQNSLKNIKWEGVALQYRFNETEDENGIFLNRDCITMEGWGWCEVTTPKILKGNYRLTSNLWSSNQFNYAVYVDGDLTANMIRYTDPPKVTSWGEFNWVKTEIHTVKVVAQSAGRMHWDYLVFTPIEDE